jgi:hypothetical protein
MGHRWDIAGHLSRTSVGHVGTHPYFPHIVELPLPPGGLREQTREIAAFHEKRGIAMHQGRGRRDDGEFCVRLCFADPGDADEFQQRFGGERPHGA